MLHFRTDADGRLIDVTADNLRETGRDPREWLCRWNILHYEQAQQLAADANKLGRGEFLAVDRGPCVSPQFDIVEAPKVGDAVSYTFNGDYYPDGEIVSVSTSRRVVRTSTGNTYYRRKLTPSWVMKGGTWSLVPGHISERNPSF